MTEPREHAAQEPSSDYPGIDPTLSGIDATSEGAPDNMSGAADADELIAQAEEIVADAAAGMADAEVVEAEVLEPEGNGAEGEAGKAGLTDELAAKAAEALTAAKAEAAEWQGRYLRLHAEWDTYRRRTEAARKEEKARAGEKLVESLLPIIDDFERTISYGKSNGEAGLLGGVEAVSSKFMSILEKAGVEVINPVGEAFDALEAQAVAMVDDPSRPDETVDAVYQKGFKMGGHVLRPAMVTVTTGGPKREKAADGE